MTRKSGRVYFLTNFKSGYTSLIAWLIAKSKAIVCGQLSGFRGDILVEVTCNAWQCWGWRLFFHSLDNLQHSLSPKACPGIVGSFASKTKQLLKKNAVLLFSHNLWSTIYELSALFIVRNCFFIVSLVVSLCLTYYLKDKI